MDYPILVKDVWKSYGPVLAVRGLSLHVPPQSIYGFLGPNGAGKSTTIRLVLGLQRPDRGEVYLFGRLMAKERFTQLRRIGSLVEAPSLYLHLTGRENLEIHRRLLDLDRRDIDEALATVDLMPAADRLVRGYSSGMKQRLGLALATASTGFLVVGILLNGMVLPRFQPELVFAWPIPWLGITRQCAEVLCLAFLLLAIQNWVALRWKSFSVAVGVGIVGLVTGVFMSVAGQEGTKEYQLFPWSLPILALGNKSSLDVPTGLIFSLIAGTVVAAVGCWNFCRREVQ
jgi:hypothetical protein